MPQILPDDIIPGSINYLNSKQMEVFNMSHTLAKDYAKYNGNNFESVCIVLSGSGGICKYHLEKVMFNAISKTLLYHCKYSEKPRVLSLGSTEVSAVYIGGTTIHSSFGIKSKRKSLG